MGYTDGPIPPASILTMASIPSGLHPRNLHQGRYDFPHLLAVSPDLAAFVQPSPRGDLTLNFADPAAVKALNQALLLGYYGLQHWDIPEGYLCPPIPGRADYLHHLADLLQTGKGIARGPTIRVLDVGVGANAIYPIIGRHCYGWSFVGADIDAGALAAVGRMRQANPTLAAGLECRHQPDPQQLFANIIRPGELFDLTLCNPPFHASADAAAAGTRRKLRNLGLVKAGQHAAPALNFGGQHNELWCPGGERGFVLRMVEQSQAFASQCHWFSCLISKQENLGPVRQALQRAGARDIREVSMAQGNKRSRFLAWSFLPAKVQQEWRRFRWAPVSQP